MSLLLKTPAEVARGLADRVRGRRLHRGWTQEELAERAGVALPTLKLFERTGKISLDRLLRIASVLGALDDFQKTFAPLPAASLDELEAQSTGPKRRYGRRRAPKPKNGEPDGAS
jgi:transcriptional regulator with XRE-family HTH domain